MSQFRMSETVCYYDGIQLAIVNECINDVIYSNRTFITTQTLDDGIFLATRISKRQLDAFKRDKIDVKTLMENPYKGDVFILLYPDIGSDYIKSMTYYEFYGFKVEGYSPAFNDWAIPTTGLYYSDN